jgi:putative ABC transport system permease protein
VSPRIEQLKSLIWKATAAEEVDAEFAFHVEMRTRELIAQGKDPDAARREAVERFGDFSGVGDACKTIANERDRDMRRTEYLSELSQDFRFAVRQLLKAPGFTFVAVATLALGIGATTAIFSAVRAVVLRPFAYAHPDRVVLVAETWRDRTTNSAVANYVDWQAQSRSFEQMAGVQYASFNVSDGGAPDRVAGARVTWNFFPVFGVLPERGRTFTADEDQPGHEQVVVLSHQLWQQRFAGSAGILGQTTRLDGRPFTIIGVMPPDFDPVTAKEQMWVPAAFTPERKQMRDEHYLDVYGLLKTSVTPQQAQRELDGIARTLKERFPRDNGERGVRVAPLSDFVIGNFRQRLFVTFGAVAFVLLIACGNVANLLLARGAARAKEMAIRAAIGAGRDRIIRQLLTESVALALAGSVAGLGVAWASIRMLVAVAPPGIPRLDETRIDATVLLFTLVAAMVSAVAFGMAPALRAGRQDLQSIMKEGGRSFAAGTRDRLRTALIVAEVALALTLLVAAGLLVRSALYLQRVDPGFNPGGLISARVALPGQAYRQGANQSAQTFMQIAERLRHVPGVRSAALTSQAPMGPGESSNGLLPEGKAVDPKNFIDARIRIVTPGYFDAMGIHLVNGRDFTSLDTRSSTLGMIVSEALAKAAWPNQDPIGKRIRCCEGGADDPKWKTVAGVAADVRSSGPMVDPIPEFYVPVQQVPPEAWDWVQHAMTLVVRGTSNDPAPLVPAIRAAVRSVDATVPVYRVQTLDESLRGTLAPARFNTMLLGALGVIGLLLAAVGIYSVIAYFVSQRTHEIGVRIALGASTANVLRLMTWEGLRPVLIGVAVGAVGALWATRLIQGSLYGVRPNDPLTFIAVAALLIGVSVLATLIPARRASKVDPVRALSG